MIIIIPLIFLLLLPHTLSAQSPEPIIAKVGSITITEREFKIRFETFPMLRPGKTDSPENRLVFAYSLIAEKMLALSAKQRGKERERAFVRAMEETRRILARDELYRREILSRRSISEKEQTNALRMAGQVRLVHYLYTADRNTIDFLRAQLKSADSFRRFEFDASLDIIRDTIIVTFGEADPRLEEIVFSLNQKEVSPVIEAAGGYILCVVDSVMPNTQFLSVPRSQQRENVNDALLQRKEWQLLEEYLNRALPGKTGYANGASVRRLSQALFSIGRENDSSRVSVTSENVELLTAALKPFLHDTLYVAGGAITSVAEGITKLLNSRFAPPVKNETQLSAALHRQFRTWVWQALLEEEALRLGLDNDPSVTSQLELWSHYFLAGEMKRALLSELIVTSWEIQQFVSESTPGVPAPKVMVEMCDLPQDMVDMVERLLEHTNAFDEIVRAIRRTNSEISVRKVWLPVAYRDTLSQRLWDIEPGSVLSIRKHDSSMTLVNVVSRNIVSEHELLKYPDVRTKVLQAKQKRRINLFLSSIRSDFPIALFDDRLKTIDLTKLQMMSIRKLGFGGTMFALPPVERLIDWIEIETPAKTPLP